MSGRTHFTCTHDTSEMKSYKRGGRGSWNYRNRNKSQIKEREKWEARGAREKLECVEYENCDKMAFAISK